MNNFIKALNYLHKLCYVYDYQQNLKHNIFSLFLAFSLKNNLKFENSCKE